jgi:hypothetical protein
VTEPHSLRDLVAWHRAAWESEMPQRLHSRATDAGGGPDWHGEFRAYLYGAVTAVDDDGEARRPAHLVWTRWANGHGSNATRARFLHHLAFLGGDIEAAWLATMPAQRRAKLVGIESVACSDFAYETLRRFYREVTRPPVVYSGPRRERSVTDRVGKSESQHRAEDAA